MHVARPGGSLLRAARCHELTARVLGGDDSSMHKFAWIALGCLASGVFVSACSDDGTVSTTASSSATSSSGMSSSTGGSGGAGSSSSGGSGGCTTELQCAPSGPCKSVACVNGACVEELVPAGTVITTAVSMGDCKRQECDASGNVSETIDDNDKPVDHNPCTLDVCTNGVPSNPVDPAKEGAQCGTGQTKCVAGKCSGCNSPGNCPDGGTCDRAVCDAQKVCGFEIDVGKLVSNADPGDCFVKECDGQGEVVTASAPNETPPQDANECDVEVCGSNGVEHNSIPDGTACGGSSICLPRSCMTGICTDGPKPGNEVVVSNQVPGDCKVEACDGAGAIVPINDDTDVPADPNPTDCSIVKCTNGTLGTGFAPAGTMCTQPNMQPGTCTISGMCS